MAHHHKLDCLLKSFDCSVVVKVKVTGKVQNYSGSYLDNISLTAESFVTKLGMMIHHHGPECHARILVCFLQVKVTVKLI